MSDARFSDAAAFGQIAFEAGCLRAWELADAPRLVLAWQDTQIAAWNQVPPAPTLATAQRWIEGQQQRLEKRLSVDFVIDIGHEDGIVGEVGLSDFNEQYRGAQIGYWLLPEVRGTGLATKAVRAFADWAHHGLQLDVIVAKCHELNVASQQTAHRSGFVHRTTDSSRHQLWMSHTRGH